MNKGNLYNCFNVSVHELLTLHFIKTIRNIVPRITISKKYLLYIQ